jgi:apolipoprotein N-acyltransferase
MLCQAVFRAVENNIELVRVTNTGRSARIDAFGRVSGEIQMFEESSRVWKIQTAADAASLQATFYTRRGDLFAYASLFSGGMLILLALARSAWKREPGT